MVAARQRSLLVADLAVKSALIALLLFAVLRPDLPQFAGKAMTGRAVGYPAAALAVPVLWLYGRSHGWRYPYLVDILLVSPFLVDMAGNALNLYDTITWWDDANHFANWAILCAGFALAVRRARPDRVVVGALALGFGAVTAILWELLEYLTFVRHSRELRSAYTDTLGDLALGLAGSAFAAALVVTVVWPHGRDSA